MLKHVYYILAATCIFGFVCGVVLYLYNNTGGKGDGEPVKETKQFFITAHMYGECERIGECASYRIKDMKTYVYIRENGKGSTERFEGVLSSEDRRNLREHIAQTSFDSIEAPFVGACATETGGSAYRYTIMSENERYTFDSCETLLTDIAFFDGLEHYFDEFAHAHEVGSE